MNNFGNKFQRNVDNYKEKLVKKHPNLKNNDSSNNDFNNPSENVSSWVGAIIAVIFIIMIVFSIYQIATDGPLSHFTLKIIFLTIGKFL